MIKSYQQDGSLDTQNNSLAIDLSDLDDR